MIKTVLADGNFDGLHFGHIEHLRLARGLGGRLVVALATDECVARRKGPGRPRFPLAKRKGMLESLRYVDEVIATDDSLALVAQMRPAVYVKGKEYGVGTPDHGRHREMVQFVQSYGGEVVYTNTMLASSSELLNQHLPVLNEAQQAFIRSVKAKHSLGDICGWLDKCQGLQALVIGEPILDVYHWMEPRGMSPKDSLVTWWQSALGQWDGGSWVIAEHLRGIGLSVELDFGDMPPIVKHRYLWGPQHGKVFAQVEGEDRVRPMRRCRPARPINVIADYGHGLISPDFAGSLVREPSEWVAVMCQSNSSNWGFNLLTKYPRADYVVADEAELRLACHDRVADLECLVEQQAERMGTKLFAVTRGHQGCLVYDGKEHCTAPALADRVVDRLGSGDAFLAATAPLAHLGAPADVVALMGNLAGAIEVGAMGQKVLDIVTLRRWLKGVMA